MPTKTYWTASSACSPLSWTLLVMIAFVYTQAAGQATTPLVRTPAELNFFQRSLLCECLPYRAATMRGRRSSLRSASSSSCSTSYVSHVDTPRLELILWPSTPARRAPSRSRCRQPERASRLPTRRPRTNGTGPCASSDSAWLGERCRADYPIDVCPCTCTYWILLMNLGLWSARACLLAADVTVVVLTWLKTVRQWRVARSLDIKMSLTTCLLRDGTPELPRVCTTPELMSRLSAPQVPGTSCESQHRAGGC